MGTEWQFENVEHIFREHAKSKGVTYDPKKPLATLDNGSIKTAAEMLGAKTWDDFSEASGVAVGTMRKWSPRTATSGTVRESIFPALCDVAARPYKAHPEAYANSSNWLPQYIEQGAAYALAYGTEPPEDKEAKLAEAWDRYNVATLLLAAFTLPPDELETTASVARYALKASCNDFDGRLASRPYAGSAEVIAKEAEALEREAVFRIPERSTHGPSFARIKSLVDERASLSQQGDQPCP